MLASDGLQYSLEIEHAFGKELEFTRRGVVHIRSLKASSAVLFQQESLSPHQLSMLKVRRKKVTTWVCQKVWFMSIECCHRR